MIPVLSIIAWSVVFGLICIFVLKPIRFPYNVYTAMVLNGIFLTGVFLIYPLSVAWWR